MLSLFSALALLVIASVDGSASFNPTVFCSNVVWSNGTKSRNVCAMASYTTPSIFQMPNGTIGYAGGYSADFTIVKGLPEGAIYTGTGNDAGIYIKVVTNDMKKCTISVTLKNGNTTNCNSCTYCGDMDYKADCTNIKHGLSIDVCQKVDEDIVFFPLNANALKIGFPVLTPRMQPVRAPRTPPVVRAPRNVPAKAPIRAPRKAPVKAQIRAPRQAPVKAPRNAPVRAPRDIQIKAPLNVPVKAPRNTQVKAPARAPRNPPV